VKSGQDLGREINRTLSDLLWAVVRSADARPLASGKKLRDSIVRAIAEYRATPATGEPMKPGDFLDAMPANEWPTFKGPYQPHDWLSNLHRFRNPYFRGELAAGEGATFPLGDVVSSVDVREPLTPDGIHCDPPAIDDSDEAPQGISPNLWRLLNDPDSGRPVAFAVEVDQGGRMRLRPVRDGES
jgi:hypothetical protein